MPLFFFCTSISENSIAGAAADTGTCPDSAPQTPLNTCKFVAGENNVVQRKQRRADDVHAAHQFVRPAVRIHAPHHHRNHLKGLRQRALVSVKPP